MRAGYLKGDKRILKELEVLFRKFKNKHLNGIDNKMLLEDIISIIPKLEELYKNNILKNPSTYNKFMMLLKSSPNFSDHFERVFNYVISNLYVNSRTFTIGLDYFYKAKKMDNYLKIFEIAVDMDYADKIIYTQAYNTFINVKDYDSILKFSFVAYKNGLFYEKTLIDVLESFYKGQHYNETYDFLKRLPFEYDQKLRDNLKNYGKLYQLISDSVKYFSKERIDLEKSTYLFNLSKIFDVNGPYIYDMYLNLLINEKHLNYIVSTIFYDALSRDKVDAHLVNSYLNFLLSRENKKEYFDIINNLINSEILDDISYVIYMNYNYKKENYEENIMFYEKIIPPKFKNSIRIRLLLAESYRKAKINHEAISQFKAILDEIKIDYSSKEFINAILGLSYSYINIGKKEDAIILLSDLIDKINNDNLSYIRAVCGYIFAKKGELKNKQKYIDILTQAKKKGIGKIEDVNSALRLLR